MNRKILIIAIFSLAIDQISKIIAEEFLILNVGKVLIPNFFNLTLCYNNGAAWSILENQKILIIILTLIALFIIYHFIYCFKKNNRNNVAFGLIMGGLSGNLIDRIIFSHVRDFLDFYIFGYDFPVFNIADICIVIGVILLIIAIIKGEDISENSSRKLKRKTR